MSATHDRDVGSARVNGTVPSADAAPARRGVFATPKGGRIERLP
jgi:hypothetical protein